MRDFIAIVAAAPDGTLAKYADFDSIAKAEAHSVEYGGFAVANPGGGGLHWAIDMSAKTVVQDEAAENAREAIGVWHTLRKERDRLLTESDWTQYNDSPLNDEVKAKWAVYRKALRDLPHTIDNPADPTWPTPPG
jgi:hypothetical protein